MKKVIAIRTGNLDNKNPIDEVDIVLDLLGHCWFGKYGTPLSSKLPSKLACSPDKYLAMLVYNDNGAPAGYQYKFYRLIDVAFSPPLDKSFPRYYEGNQLKFGSWLKLQKFEQLSYDISDIIVLSSQMPIRFALKNSMRGHFLCITRR